jgi:ankyrin repeat protein
LGRLRPNPVYGFEDPMSGIPDRQAKLHLVKALLAHGANVNARMTKRQPQFATGYTDAVGATPFLLAASVQDMQMMRILFEAGADPKITTATKATAISVTAHFSNRVVSRQRLA